MKFKHLKCRMRRFCATAIAGCIVLSSAMCTSSTAFAENNGTTAQTEDANELKYYLGTPVNTGKDNGFSGENVIDSDDPHFGWELGRFYISGYTRVSDTEETPIFLKNVGDTVTLWFNLEQDIACLNGSSDLSIYADKNGYDEYFGIEKMEAGKGTLIIRHTDYQNKTGEPVIHTDYLSANAIQNKDVKVELCEEGDYEVALNYEIMDNPRHIGNVNVFPSYHNYRIFFKFKVRNGNCMVYPFDVKTKGELTNSSITENGFYLDLAKSRYLDIDIKKEVLKEGADGLTEDIRFNRPAKDGDQYTDEGIYTITVTNKYTEQQITKVIYVGTNNVLKAYVTTNLSIQEINEQVALGAEIADDGTIILPPTETTTTTTVTTTTETSTTTTTTTTAVVTIPITEESTEASTDVPDSENAVSVRGIVWAGVGGVIAVLLGCIGWHLWKQNKLKSANTEKDGEQK